MSCCLRLSANDPISEVLKSRRGWKGLSSISYTFRCSRSGVASPRGGWAAVWSAQPPSPVCAAPAAPFGSPEAEARWRFYVYCRQQGLWPQEVTAHDPDRDDGWFDSFCPLRNVTESYPPTLLIHGDQDTDVPFEQSVLMAGELARHGVEHEFVTLEGLGHSFDGAGLTDPRVSGVFDTVLAFLGQRFT